MKYCFIDIETTGLNPEKNGIIQLSCIVDIDGNPKEAFNYYVKPFSTDEIVPEALQVTGTQESDFLKSKYFPPDITYRDFTRLLNVYIDKYDNTDKFVFIGYNANFDYSFLRQFFKKNNDEYFGSYFHRYYIDVLQMLNFCIVFQDKFKNLPSRKLSEVCKYFSIPLNAHDSFSDILASRKLMYFLLDNHIKKGGEIK